MTIIVCIPLDEEYFVIGDQIYDLLLDPKAPPQKQRVSRAAELLVESLLEVLIVGMFENVEMKPFAKKIVLQLEGVIQKTAKALVHKVILKLSNKDLWPLIQYFKDLELELDGQGYLSFPLEDFAKQALNQSTVDIKNGDLKEARDNFHQGVENLLDQGLLFFYKEPMAMIKLGMIARKIVDLGYTTIHGAINVTINKVIHGMELHELASLKSYIDTLSLEVE